MKTPLFILKSSAVACVLLGGALRLTAQGSAFTYQGHLNDGSSPASGSYDLRFAIYDASAAGTLIARPVTNAPTPVSNGLFTVVLDFGDGVFTGPGRWLEIAVRTNSASPIAFTTLGQRQDLTPSPYAIFANTASNLSGTISSANLSGTYSGPVTFNNGADTFDGTFIGQFLGSTFTGGTFTGNFIGTGSGLMDVWHTAGNFGTTAGPNFLGTTDNQPLVIKVNGTEAMRYEPTAETPNIIGGWSGNYAQPNLTGVTIGGGGSVGLFNGKTQPNVVTNNGYYGTIAGGYNNEVTNYGGAILGGSVHLAGGYFAVIGGGQFHTNLGNYSFIGGGMNNAIGFGAAQAFIGAGAANQIQDGAAFATIAGGNNNKIQSSARGSTIGGGELNSIEADIFSPAALTVGGGTGNAIRTNAAFSLIGGGYYNTIQPYSLGTTIAGGAFNVIQGHSNYWSTSTFDASTIGGGAANTIQSEVGYATIAGGVQNVIKTNSSWSTIGGGAANAIDTNSPNAVVAGGLQNTAYGSGSTISGGIQNNASGGWATVPGGRNNLAQGDQSLAAGTQAKALHDGSFVWADPTPADFASTAVNQFLLRASGGVGINTNNPNGAALNVNGLVTAAAFAGNGSSLSGVNATTVNGLSSSSFWFTTGNAGTTPGANFIGTTDNKAVVIKGSFVGVGRTNAITGSDYFSVEAPVGGTLFGGMYLNTASATGKPFYGYAQAGGAVAYHYVDGSDANKWKLNIGGDRLTVTTAGLVGIGTTLPDATLSVGVGTADKPGGGSWGTFSDARLKKNIRPLTGALDQLMELRPVTFEYKDPQSIHELPGTQIGMIAQEVEKVFPDWVDTAPNGMKRLSIHGFEALTVGALRELRNEKDAKISDLKKSAEELRKELTETRSELAAQKELVSKMAARFDALEQSLARLERKSSAEFAESQGTTAK